MIYYKWTWILYSVFGADSASKCDRLQLSNISANKDVSICSCIITTVKCVAHNLLTMKITLE